MRILVFCVIALPMLLEIHAKETITATGRITCNGAPIAHSKISLMDDDVGPDDRMATGYTDINGNFKITGRGGDFAIRKRKRRPDPYIRPEYYYSGPYGKLSIKPSWKTFRKRDKTITLNDRRGHVHFGTVYFKSDECKAYVEFLKAMKEYRRRVGLNIPVRTLEIKTRIILHGGAPYATTSTIRFPKRSKIDEETARHELAHIVRHTYDGSLGHFLKDVAKYFYTRNHYCGKRTNHGFAFNEGWAEFYANTCFIVTGSAGDYKVEGNVAIALRKLKTDCRSSYFRMVNVLIRNRGKIHSFSQYRSAHKALYRCP